MSTPETPNHDKPKSDKPKSDKPKSDKKVANSLVALSCAAVLAVYSAGYARTREAANQFDAQSAARRPAPAPVDEVRTVDATVAAGSTQETGVVSPREVARQVTESTTVQPAAVTPEAVVETPTAAAVPEPVAVAAVTPTAAPAPAPVAEPAPAPAPTPAAPPAPAQKQPVAKWKDGSYTGWGTSRHGDIQATVVIDGGRIFSAVISQCLTRYSCDVIDALPPQPAVRQSPDVDYVSRATESADAFYYALVDALDKAKLPK